MILLQVVRTEGDWEKWLHFFITGVIDPSTQAVETTQKVIHLFLHDRNQLNTLGKQMGSVLRSTAPSSDLTTKPHYFYC
jgi:Fic family protein